MFPRWVPALIALAPDVAAIRHAAHGRRHAVAATQPEDEALSGAEWTHVEITRAFPHLQSGQLETPEGPAAPPDQNSTDAIVAAHAPRRWWGFPNYAHELDLGPRTWEEFARLHGHLGRTCTEKHSRKHCGTAFVCKEGVCGECTISRDCGEHFRCEAPEIAGRRLCIPRDLQTQWNWREVVCTILVIITAVFSAAAGMGGGGVYVPLLLLLLGFSTKEAVPLSQAMIVGGATVNVIMFCGERHPKYPHRPKIDYEVVMMLNPGLAAGVTIGVMLNVISPQWLIVVVLLVTLALALQKSFTKGLKEWQKESQALEAARIAGLKGNSGSGGGAVDGPAGQGKAAGIKLADFASFAVLARNHQRSLGLIVGCWAAFFLSNVMKAPQCSTMYWMQLFGMLLTCGAFTVAGAWCLTGHEAGGGAEGMLAWTPRTLKLYPLLSTVAGFLGGFLGIGGGIIMGPLLLELGMLPEASQATTAAFVFLSSSLATIQFVVLGKAMPQYALWFTTWVVISTFIGQTAVDYVLRRWQRSSLIVLSIAAIIAGSLVMMTAIGTMDTITDLQRGANMGFMPHHLCT